MEEKNKISVIVIIILSVLLVGLSGYLVYDKVILKNSNDIVSNKENSNEINNDSNEIAFDKTEAEKIAEKYWLLRNFTNSHSDFIWEVLNQVKSQKVKCSTLISSIEQSSDNVISDEIKNDLSTACYNTTEEYSFDEVSKKVYDIYGVKLERKSYKSAFAYYYDKTLDYFISVPIATGYEEISLIDFGVKSAVLKDNTLQIETVIVEFQPQWNEVKEQNFHVITINGKEYKYTESEFEKLDVSDFINEHIDELPVTKLIFNKSAEGKYILDSIM